MGVDQILNGRAVEVQSATVKDLLDAGSVETGSVDTGELYWEFGAVEDITRSVDTWYQNTFDYPIKISVRASNSGAGSLVRPIIQVHDTQSTDNNNRLPSNQLVAHDSTSVFAQATATVGPQDYYYIELFGSGASLDEVKRRRLGGET